MSVEHEHDYLGYYKHIMEQTGAPDHKELLQRCEIM